MKEETSIFKIICSSIVGAILVGIIIYAFRSCSEIGGRAGSGKCTICNKSASHTFQGYDYCREHYNDAVSWAIDNAND